ncbi:MAG: glycine--tRNA ligase subunit beta [Bacillota bacterium]
MTRDFLFEIGVEEMPARFLAPALEQLKELAAQKLGEHRLEFVEIFTCGTPRRLVLFVKGIAATQRPVLREVKGPAAKVAFDEHKKPTRAAVGFAKSQGVDVAELVVKPVGPVEYVFAVIREKGKPAPEVLTEICPSFITELHFPRFMRWGEGDLRFARPIRWLLALFGDQVIPVTVAGVAAGRVTYGHRFLSGDRSLHGACLTVENPADYFQKMRGNFVLVDPAERRAAIREQLARLAAQEGGKVQEDEELLEEVVNLVEYPTALTGSFDESFLNLPPEVLITSMREHQRYFPVFGPAGRLLPRFIAVSNTTDGAIIRRGYERVLRARLTDAAFFWEEDLKTPLAQRVGALKKIVWQESLGTLYDKVERVASLASLLVRRLGAEEEQQAVVFRAARLAKADLTTSMVYEFPELQGIMGREYASRQGEGQAVAQAIFEHYLPRFSGDRLPETLPGVVLSIADKMDTLVGCFALGIQPTGSQDPYALRRLALGICHIILEHGLVLSLRELVAEAYAGYRGRAKLELPEERVSTDLEDFFAQRLRGLFAERGLPYDVSEAALAAGMDDLYGVWQRAGALADFRRDSPAAFDRLLTAFSRANNLSKRHRALTVDASLFLHPAEENLYRELLEICARVQKCLEERDYRGALAEMTALAAPVDNFFDGVMVMVEDERLRNNRLGLLKNVVNLILSVADLSKLS